MTDDIMHELVYAPDEPTMDFPDVEGWSGRRVQQLLHDLAKAGRALGGGYMEVGSYKGRTLLSAAQAEVPCVGIDDFSQTGLGHRIDPYKLHAECERNIRRHAPRPEWVRLLREPWERVFNRPVGLPASFWTGTSRDAPRCSVFFYDGDHARVPTMEALKAVTKFLVPGAVVVVDDISGYGVLEAVLDVHRSEPGYTWLNVKLPPRVEGGADGWWNGIACMGWNP